MLTPKLGTIDSFTYSNLAGRDWQFQCRWRKVCIAFIFRGMWKGQATHSERWGVPGLEKGQQGWPN
jgi:hypothetical protein